MFDFHEKRKIRNLVYSKVVIGFVVMATIVLSFSVYERYTVEKEMLAKRMVKTRELEELEKRAAALESEVEHLKDERGIEEELRSRFDVAKEGEQVIILLDGVENDTVDPETLTTPPGVQKEEERKSFFGVLKFW